MISRKCKTSQTFTACLAIQLFVATNGYTEEWSRFRGPNGSGCAAAPDIPVSWTDADYAWKAALPGTGISSPIVWGNKLFITSADAENRHLVCLETETGKKLWTREFPFAAHKKHDVNSYATSTPAADGRHVYTLWQAPESSALVALDHNGRDVWKFEFGGFLGGHGGGISPIVHDGLVIVANEQEGPSYVTALDASTGQPRWKLARSTKRASYATPCVFERAGRPAEIILTEWKQGITAVDAKTGRKNWELPVFGESTERAVSSPIVAGDLVIGTCGFVTGNKHTVALRPGERETTEVYRIERNVSYLPTSLVFGNWLFSWSELGIVSCYDVATGQQLWQQRIGGKFASSPVCNGKTIYNVNEDGVAIAIAAGATYQELGRSELGERCQSTPAIANGRMFLRTASHVFAVGRAK